MCDDYLERLDQLTIGNNTIEECKGDYGAGITIRYGKSPLDIETSKIIVDDNNILNNEGSGILVYDATAVLKKNIIDGNHNERDTAIWLINQSLAIVHDNHIKNNTAEYEGAGIYVDAQATLFTIDKEPWPRQNNPDNPFVRDTNTYSGNQADSTDGVNVYFAN